MHEPQQGHIKTGQRRLLFVGGAISGLALIVSLIVSRRHGKTVIRPVVVSAAPSPTAAPAAQPATPTTTGRQDRLVVSVLAMAAVVLLGSAAFLLRPAAGDDLLDDGLLLVVLGAAASAGALWLARPLPPLAEPTDAPLQGNRSGWLSIGAGATLLFLLTEINTGLLGIDALEGASVHLQFVLLCAGLGLLTWGAAGRPRIAGTVRLDPREATPLLVILALALGLRVWALGDTVRTLVDEVHWIVGIQAVEWNPQATLIVSPSTYLPTTLVYSYVQSGFVSLFGHNLFGLRVTSAVVGMLNVLALYGLARAMFGVRTALIAALILATFPPHLHFSRIAMAHVGDTLFGTLALMFIVRGLRHNRRPDWALAGLALGLTQYFYEGGRLLYAPLALIWVAMLALVTRTHLRAHRRGLALTAVTGVLVALPVYTVILASQSTLTSRMDEAGLGSGYWRDLLADGLTGEELRDLFDRFTLPYQAFVHEPERALYYGGDQAMILPLLVPFALLGVAYCLYRWRTPALVLVLWVAATALGNALIRDSVQYPRYVVVFPALALLIAVGISEALPLLMPRTTPTAGVRRAGVVMLFVVAAALGAVQMSYYFGPHLQLYNVQFREAKDEPDPMDAVLRAAQLPPNTVIYLISEPETDINPPRSFIGFLLNGRPDMPLLTAASGEITPDFLESLPRSRNYAFFVGPQDINTIRLLQSEFRVEPPQVSPYDVPAHKQYLLLFAPR